MKKLSAGDKINPDNMYYLTEKDSGKHFLFKGWELFSKEWAVCNTNDLYFDIYKIQSRDELEKLKLLQRLSR